MFKNFTDKLQIQPKVEITISNRTIFRVLAMIVATFVLILAIKQAAHALTIVFIAFFLALALNAPVHWISQHVPGKRKGSRALATSLAYLVVVGALIGFLASIVPPIIRETQDFIKQAPQLVKDLRNEDTDVGRFVNRYNLDSQIDDFSEQLSDRLKNASGAAITTTSRIGSSVFTLLTILVLTFMMLVEGPRWVAFARELLPKQRRKSADRLGLDMYKVVKGYVNGQVTLAAIAAVFIFPALLILDVNFAFALMFVVFICGLIPMVGHTIGAVIVSLVALFTSPLAALIILSYYILYQQIENYLIQPRIQANSTNMSPLLVFMSVVIGVSFNGLLGGLVAIPVAGCLRVLILEYLRRYHVLEAQPVINDEIEKVKD